MTVRRPLPAPARRPQRGSVAVFVIFFALAAFMLAGLVVDGGMALNVRQRAADVAEQAARAGADKIDQGALRVGVLRVNQGAADNACQRFLARHAHTGRLTGSCASDSRQVRAAVTVTQSTYFLSMLGIHRFEMKATATARPETGFP